MRHFNYNVVKIKSQNDGEWVAIPALQGKNLYETAVEYGFQGTEDDWFNMLITDGWITPYQNLKAAFELFRDLMLGRTINGHALDEDIVLVPDDVGAANKTLTNVQNNDFITKAKECGFDTGAGVLATQTVFNDDGSITETSSDGSVKVTVFNEDGSITENYTLATGDQVQKTITFNEDGSISETVSTVTEEVEEETTEE